MKTLLALLAAWSCAATSGARTPNPIHQHDYVRIGGIDQWLAIDGSDRANPVLLVVHGGPGNPLSPYADQLFGAWQGSFTVVTWDQRLSGRTYARNEPVTELTEQRIAATDLTIERLVADGIEVAEYLERSLGKRKVILTASSWGSVLGVHMAHERPDLFYAYVGVSQMVNGPDNLAASYRATLEAARRKQDAAALSTLADLGPPPWKNPRNFGRMRRIIRAYEGAATSAAPTLEVAAEYASAEDRAAYDAGEDLSFVKFVGLADDGMLARIDLPALGATYSMPMLFLQGEEDLLTRPEITRAFYDSLQAPRKKLVMVPQAGHDPNFAMLDAQFRLLKDEVLPLVK